MGKKKKKQTRVATIMEGIGHELKVNPPRILAKTRAKKGKAAAEAQRKAILLSKARKAGAKIPFKRKKKASKKSRRW